MDRTLRCFTGLISIAILGIAGSALGVADPDESASSGQFRQLERDIPSLYLLNGLCLSPEQAGKLGSLLERARSLEGKYRKQAEGILRTYEKDLAGCKAEIERWAARGIDPSEKSEARAAMSRRFLKSRNELGELRHGWDVEMDALSDKTYALLSDSQRAIVDKFTPCFIPPQDFRSPERVGQAAADTSFVEESLARLRRLPEAEAASPKAIEKALDRLVPYALTTHHVRYTEDAEGSLRKEIGRKLKAEVPKLRSMSDADFELEKSKIATRVLPLPDPDRQSDPGVRRWKIRHYLLNTGVLDVVQTRAGQPAAAGAGASTSSRRRELLAPARSLRESFETAQVIGGLDLSGEQARKILDVAKGAIRKREEVSQEIEQAMAAGLESYEALRRELAGGQPSGKGESAAGHHHGSVRSLYDGKLVSELLSFERQLDGILTASQVAFLSEMDADQSGPEKRFGADEEVSKSLDLARNVLSDARRMAGPAFSKEKENLCRRFVNQWVERTGAAAARIDVESEVKRAVATLERARLLGQPEYSAKREDLVAELCPKVSDSRPRVYGTKYEHGKPVPVLGRTTELVFSESACNILDRMAGRR